MSTNENNIIQTITRKQIENKANAMINAAFTEFKKEYSTPFEYMCNEVQDPDHCMDNTKNWVLQDIKSWSREELEYLIAEYTVQTILDQGIRKHVHIMEMPIDPSQM